MKESALLLLLFISKTPSGYANYRRNAWAPEMENFTPAYMKWWTYVRTFSEPNFLGCIDNQIFLHIFPRYYFVFGWFLLLIKGALFISLLFVRGPNRVIEFPCFDSKLQQARNACEPKQAKRRECLPRTVSQHNIYLRYILLQIMHGKQICNRKQTFWKNKVH